ncbi:MAG: 1-aminocyclopropane-1-carboxylate deaminase/D-cysteine desulfhydrase [Bacteroidia bacterium]
MFNKPYAPIEQVNLPEFSNAGINVFIKREDLAHPFVSGNKMRKLKYYFQDAAANGKNTIVTFGGAYSNHLLATAAACAKMGFISYGFVRGEPVKNYMLSLCKIFGMHLFFVERNTYKTDKINFAKSKIHDIENCYFIDEGGQGELGEKGVAEIIEDLSQNYNHIFCSVGTGSTMLGLLQRVEKNNYQTKIHGVPVLKGYDDKELLKTFDKSLYEWHDGFHFGGYAKIDKQLTQFVSYFATNTGILLDYVYEGKMFYALTSLAKQGYFKNGESVLALHNGGLIGMLDMMKASY